MQAAAYEACRVFRDRLVHSDHTARFDSIVADTLRKHWRVNIDLSSSVFATIGSLALQVKPGKTMLAAAGLHVSRLVTFDNQCACQSGLQCVNCD